MTNRRWIALALGVAVLSPAVLRASDTPWSIAYDAAQVVRQSKESGAPQFNYTSNQNTPSDSPPQAASDASPMLTLDAGGTASKIHGFLDLRFNTGYMTPRGLVVENSGVNFQPLAGLIFDVYHGDGPINDVSLLFGTWGNFTSYHPEGDIWDEQDFFTGFSVQFLDKFTFSYSIMAWTFPDVSSTHVESNPSTEYNMDFKLAFDDTQYLKDFAMHPYVDIFWNFAGASSPVVSQATAQGTNAHTFYVEMGVSPSYTLKAITDYPITFTVPTYFSVGDPEFWGKTPSGDSSAWGVFSTGLKISMPLAFIPKDFGNWQVYVGGTYLYTINPALSYVNETILSQGDGSNRYLGYMGVGFSF